AWAGAGAGAVFPRVAGRGVLGAARGVPPGPPLADIAGTGAPCLRPPRRNAYRAAGGLTAALRRPTVWGVMRTIGVAVALGVVLVVGPFAAAASALLDYVPFDGIDYIRWAAEPRRGPG